MAYWWVNQKKSHKSEYAGGFIWAPIQKEGKPKIQHWKNLEDVRSGDIIFSYIKGKINTIGLALNDSYLAEKPIGHAPEWPNDGRRVDVEYTKTSTPLNIKDIYANNYNWQEIYAPIKKNGVGANEGYLFEVPSQIGEDFLKKMNFINIIDVNPKLTAANKTTQEALINARLGQGNFRKALIKRWSGKCAITQCSIVNLLTASHIKPWAVSDNDERLDPDNGLLLSPNLNSLFDKFLISFSERGELIKSNRISWPDLDLLNVSRDTKLEGLNSGNKKYLTIHNEIMLSKKS